jgi:hypothetical protein
VRCLSIRCDAVGLAFLKIVSRQKSTEKWVSGLRESVPCRVCGQNDK